MKKLFVVFLLVAACFSVVSAQTIEQEIQQLNECCAKQNATLQTQIGLLDLQKIQDNFNFIENLLCQPEIKKRMINKDLCTRVLGIYITKSFIILSDVKRDNLKERIHKSDCGELKEFQAIQNLDRIKFIQELKEKLCQ